MHFDREFQIVLRRSRMVCGGMCALAPQRPSQHPKNVRQRGATANRAYIMRAVANGLTINTQHGFEERNCLLGLRSLSVGSCLHNTFLSTREMLTRQVLFVQFFRTTPKANEG